MKNGGTRFSCSIFLLQVSRGAIFHLRETKSQYKCAHIYPPHRHFAGQVVQMQPLK